MSLRNVKKNIETMAVKAMTAITKGDKDLAEQLLQQIVTLNPTNGPAHFELAKLYLNTGSQQLALTHATQATSCDKDNPDYPIFQASVLLSLKDPLLSLTTMQQFVDTHPDHPLAMTVLGYYLNICGRQEEAELICRKSLQLDPDLVGAHQNLAVILYHQNRVEESLRVFKRILELDPENTELLTYLGMINLLKGNFEEGWHYYQKRLQYTILSKRSLNRPIWQGEPLHGKTLFVYAEQGIGDTLQFVRYLPLLAEQKGATVILEVQESIFPLLKNFPGIHTLLTRDDLLPDYDFYTPLLTLPAIFQTTLYSIPAMISQLALDTAAVNKWKSEIDAIGSGRRIGFVWAGNPLHENDHNRSCRANAFQVLWSLSETWWFSLQKGEAANDLDPLIATQANVFNLNPVMNSFVDTAAIISNLDVIITVDTSVAHLAATLQKPVWLLLPFTPDWRWFLERSDSPWYPGMRLFRQKKMQDWGDVFMEVAQELKNLKAE